MVTKIDRIPSNSRVESVSHSSTYSPFAEAYPEIFDLDRVIPNVSATNNGKQSQTFKSSDFN